MPNPADVAASFNPNLAAEQEKRTALILEDLARSELVPADFGVDDLTPVRAFTRGQYANTWFYAIPYPKIGGGEMSSFVRYRKLEGSYPNKYYQPKNTGVRLYVPPSLAWKRRRLLDPNETLWITEGEKKALALAKAGLCAVGIPGVAAGVRKIGPGTTALIGDLSVLLPDESERAVVLCFDRDYEINGSVQDDLVRLARQLHSERQARVVKLTYPELTDDNEHLNGIDDWIVAGYDASTFKTSPMNEVLEQLLARYVWIHSQEKAWDRVGQQYLSRTGLAHSYSDRMIGGRDNPVDLWMTNRKRLKAERLVCVPGLPDARLGEDWNRYLKPDVRAVEGDAHEPFMRHLERLFTPFLGDEDEEREDGHEAMEHLLNVFAWLRQHPDEQITHHVQLWSTTEGSGKTSALTILGRAAAGTNNLDTIDFQDIRSNFTAWAGSGKTCLLADDVKPMKTFRDWRDHIHAAITGTPITVDAKHEKPYKTVFHGVILSTANYAPKWLREDSRRDAVFRVREQKCDIDPDWMSADENNPVLQSLAFFLEARDLSNFSPTAYPLHGRRQEYHAGASTRNERRETLLEAALEEIHADDEGRWPFDIYDMADLQRTLEMELNVPERDRNARRITDVLADFGPKVSRRMVKVEGKSRRLTAIRNGRKWSHAKPREWADAYAQRMNAEKTRGPNI